MGHEVKVFTTARDVVRGASEWDGVDEGLGYEVVRAERFLQWKKTLFTFAPGVRKAIRNWDPDIGFVMGAGYGPPYYWMSALPKRCRVISQFSDLPTHRSGKWVWVLKKCWYRRVFQRSSLVLAVTEATADLLKGVGERPLRGKLRMSGLSFDAEDFRFGAKEACPEAARDFAQKRDFLVAVVTRVSPEKKLDALFASVEAFLKDRPEAGLVMAGFRNDAYSQDLKQRIMKSEVAAQCCCLPVLLPREINGLFSWAHCSVWTQVSIGLQHSMASGCPVLLKSGWPAKHILKEGVSGFVYEDLRSVGKALERARNHPWEREAVFSMVEPYRSERMLEGLLDEALEGVRDMIGRDKQ